MITRTQAEERVLTGFWIHLGVFVIVVSGLAVLNMTRNPDNPWFLWVLGGWGIGVIAHALGLFAIPGGKDRMIAKTIERMERRKNRQERLHQHAH